MDWADLKILVFDVVGEPKAEPRPRVNSKAVPPRIYVPSSAHGWKRQIREAALVEMLKLTGGGVVVPEPAPRAFALGVVFRMPRPKSHFRSGRNAHLLKRGSPERHTGKPDLDNLLKAAKDALGAWDGRPSLLWGDDSQVVRYVGRPEKRYTRPGELPGLTVVVWAC